MDSEGRPKIALRTKVERARRSLPASPPPARPDERKESSCRATSELGRLSRAHELRAWGRCMKVAILDIGELIKGLQAEGET